MNVAMRRILYIIIAFAMVMCFAQEAMAADTSAINVSAVILSKNKCKFNIAAATIDFGALNPAATVTVIINASLDIVCNGASANATFSITDDDGLHETGINANRLQHTVTTTEYMNYTLTYTPTSATIPKGVFQTITATGTLNASEYAVTAAIPGTYSDTVTLTIVP